MPPNPYELLESANEHGIRAWSLIKEDLKQEQNIHFPILTLLDTLEDHTKNLMYLCSIKDSSSNISPKQIFLYNHLLSFYRQPELSPSRHQLHNYTFAKQIHNFITNTSDINSPVKTNNRFSALTHHEVTGPIMTEETPTTRTPHQSNSAQPPDRMWVNDTNITRISEMVFRQQQKDKASSENTGDESSDTPQYSDPAFNNIPVVPPSQHIRFNLMRHRNTTSNTTTLKLFKSFAAILRQVDSNLSILPYQANRVHISPLSTLSQIQKVDENKLILYFHPYHKRQYYSLSGYFNIGTTLSPDELFQHHAVLEWLDCNRYHIRVSPSQNEEMVPIGALVFSSIYMYRDDLKQSIMEHPLWNPTNDPSPPIFDLFTGDLLANDNKSRMIFISAERSKQDVLTEFFRKLYDGVPKEYPNGNMMLFIPMNEHMQYSTEYRQKLIYNHEAFIGSEEAITINGLQNLNNKIKLMDGTEITIRLLLKSLPATNGMSRSQLFQFVEPNNSGITTLATFQSVDKSFITQRKSTLESELRGIVDPNYYHKLFLNDAEGIWCDGISRNKNGKIIPIKHPSRPNADHIAQIGTILRSPPKKHPTSLATSTPPNLQYKKMHYTIQGPSQSNVSNITPTPNPPSAGMNLDARPTSNVPEIDRRFLTIEETLKQQHENNAIFHQRISTLEHTTTSIDQKMDSVLTALETLAHPAKRRAHSRPESPSTDDDDIMEENSHPNSQPLLYKTGCLEKCPR